MKKKDKNIAGVLALFFGWLGLHRYYLGQKQWGLAYTIAAGVVLWVGKVPILGWILTFLWFPLMLVISLVDAITFFAMEKQRFDEKFNQAPRGTQDRPDFDRRQRKRRREPEVRKKSRSRREPNVRKKTSRRQNPYKKSGVEKFKEYDYEGAIEDFKKSLEIAPDDIASHFNLACAYSLTEQAGKSFYHLDQAVKFGFRDFQKIEKHHALAYLRIQPEFESFEQSGFRLGQETPEAEEEDLLQTKPDLLDQLNKLVELRKRGFLTEKEFEKEKKRLMG